MAGIEGDPEERIAQVAVDDRLQLATDLADVESAVPLGHRLEVRRHQPFDVVAGPVGELRCVLGNEAGAAIERSPDAERDRERVASFDRPVTRAQQPEPCPRSGSEHQVAREGRAVPAEQASRLPFGHPRLEPVQDVAYAAGRLARRPLERRQLLDLVDDAQPVAGVDEQVVGVLHPTSCTGGPPELVDEEGRELDHRSLRVRLPADGAHPPSRRDALRGEDLRQRGGRVAWLAGQAEVLEPHESHRRWCGAGDPVALVADQECRIAGRPDDEHRLFEPRVEPGEIGEVGAVLPIAPDDQVVVPTLRHPCLQALHPVGVDRSRDDRLGRAASRSRATRRRPAVPCGSSWSSVLL